MLRLSVGLCTWLGLAGACMLRGAAVAASATNAAPDAFAQAIYVNDTSAAVQAVANSDADTLTAAIVAATIKGSADSIGFFGLADRIGAAVSQTNIPSQTAIQSYSQAFAQFLLSCKSAGNCSTGASSEPNGDENAAVVLSVAGRAGQGQSFPQILTQAEVLGVQASDLSGVLAVGEGSLEPDQLATLASAASNVYGANTQALTDAAGNVSDIASRLLSSASLGARSGAGMGAGGDNSPNGPNDQMVAQTIVTALKQAQVPSAVQAQAFAQAFAQSLGPAEAYDTSEVLMIAAVSAGQTGSITQGYSQVKASPNNSANNAYFCQITNGAQEISSALGQVAADAVKSAYGQAAVDAVDTCQSVPGSW